MYILFIFILYTEVFTAVFSILIQSVCKTERYINSAKLLLFLNRVFLNALCIINIVKSQHQIMYFQVIIFASRFQ